MRKSCERKFTPLGHRQPSACKPPAWPCSLSGNPPARKNPWPNWRVGKDSRKIRWLVLIPCIWRSQILPKLYTTEAEVNSERMRSRQQSLCGTLHPPQSPQHAFPHLRSHRRSSSFDSGTVFSACVQYWKWMKMGFNLHSWPLEWGKWSLTRQSRHDPWLIPPDPTWTSRQTLCAFW